jgi:hypothetical protein
MQWLVKTGYKKTQDLGLTFFIAINSRVTKVNLALVSLYKTSLNRNKKN